MMLFIVILCSRQTFYHCQPNQYGRIPQLRPPPAHKPPLHFGSSSCIRSFVSPISSPSLSNVDTKVYMPLKTIATTSTLTIFMSHYALLSCFIRVLPVKLPEKVQRSCARVGFFSGLWPSHVNISIPQISPLPCFAQCQHAQKGGVQLRDSTVLDDYILKWVSKFQIGLEKQLHPQHFFVSIFIIRQFSYSIYLMQLKCIAATNNLVSVSDSTCEYSIYT